MNRKTMIQVSVVIFCFGMSGIVIYRGLFAKKTNPVTVPPPALSTSSGPTTATPGTPGSATNPGKAVPGPGGTATPTKPGATSAVSSASQANEPILPYGKTWDVQKVLNKQSLQYGIVLYPKLDPNSDVGLNVSDLFTSLNVGK